MKLKSSGHTHSDGGGGAPAASPGSPAGARVRPRRPVYVHMAGRAWPSSTFFFFGKIGPRTSQRRAGPRRARHMNSDWPAPAQPGSRRAWYGHVPGAAERSTEDGRERGDEPGREHCGSPWGGTGHWRGHGAGVARAVSHLWLWVARAWCGHVLLSQGTSPRHARATPSQKWRIPLAPIKRAGEQCSPGRRAADARRLRCPVRASVRGCSAAVRGCSAAVRGCSAAVRGCSAAVRGCSAALLGCSAAARAGSGYHSQQVGLALATIPSRWGWLWLPFPAGGAGSGYHSQQVGLALATIPSRWGWLWLPFPAGEAGRQTDRLTDRQTDRQVPAGGATRAAGLRLRPSTDRRRSGEFCYDRRESGLGVI
eukprot:gene6241-biopygen7325